MHPASPSTPPVTAHRSAAGFTERLPQTEVRPFMLPAYQGQTYYGLAPLRHSHYEWRTALAFFCNGLAGGAQIIATAADLFGGPDRRSAVRAGRYLALAAGTATTLILISALHTRQRWYNMLRMFKPSSPMSIGIWSITPFVLLSGGAAAGQLLEDFGYAPSGRWVGRVSGVPSALLGTLAMTYMGTELEETSMPLWATSHPALAPLYAAAGISNSAAALMLLPPSGGKADFSGGLRKLAFASTAAESALGASLAAQWRRTPDARAFSDTSYNFLFSAVEVSALGSLALLELDGFRTNSRPGAVVASALLKLAGALLQQFVLVYAGRESGRRARDYFEYTRPRKSVSAEPGPALESAGAQGRRPAKESRADRKPQPGRPAMNAGLKWGLVAVGTVLLLSSIARHGQRREKAHDSGTS